MFKFDEKIPYRFQDLTGLEERCRTGSSIVENDKVIGGIFFESQNIPVPQPISMFLSPNLKCCGLAAIELLPECRGKGKGTLVVKQLLSEFDCIHAAVQEEKAMEWWKGMGALPHAVIMHPDDFGKPDAKAHTVAYILGRDELLTKICRGFFLMMGSQIPGVSHSKAFPEIDFSKNIL